MGNSLYVDNTPGLKEAKRGFGKGLYREVLDTDKLKQKNYYIVRRYLIVFLAFFSLIIAVLSTYMLGKYAELNFIEKDEQESSVMTAMAIIGIVFSVFGIIAVGIFWGRNMNAISVEDRFVTQTNLI